MNDLREKTIRGGSARVFAQGLNFIVRIGSTMVLARMLSPRDFGLVGMVTAFTGVLLLLRDFGLSAASIQSAHVTKQQSSNLFWINVFVGGGLSATAVSLAPALGAFYHEPRLVTVTSIVAIGFFLNGLGVQHSSILQRQMRFTALAFVDIVALIVSALVAIVMARTGAGYWALAIMTVSLPFITTIGLWFAAKWVPGPPRRGAGMRPLIRFGGAMTLNGMVTYVAANSDKVLLGRFWGADAIGLYGRAYQLIRIPTDNLNSAVGEVAFAALSRLQDDPVRLKRYFLKGYSLVVAATLPLTLACVLFAEDTIRVLLGPKWHDAAEIFRFLGPTILVYAMVNPLGWLLNALGMIGRGLKIAVVFTPFIIVGYFLGLPYGPRGVALAYSVVMVLWVLPLVKWAVHGTVISLRDILSAVSRPLISSLVGAVLALLARAFLFGSLPALPRLVLENSVLLAVYACVLLFGMRQKSLYLDLVRSSRGPVLADEGSDLVGCPR